MTVYTSCSMLLRESRANKIYAFGAETMIFSEMICLQQVPLPDSASDIYIRLGQKQARTVY